jgi:hypothetical protein
MEGVGNRADSAWNVGIFAPRYIGILNTMQSACDFNQDVTIRARNSVISSFVHPAESSSRHHLRIQSKPFHKTTNDKNLVSEPNRSRASILPDPGASFLARCFSKAILEEMRVYVVNNHVEEACHVVIV